MSSLKLAQLAILLEGTGFAALFTRGDALLQLAFYFAAHGCASLLVAAVMSRFIPALYPKTERTPFGYFAALSFFVPVLGVAGLLLLLLLSRFPTGPRESAIQLVEGPSFRGEEQEPEVAFSRKGIRPVLQSASAPSALKLKALLALRSVPSRAANNLIREMLQEPMDDMRLLAYGLLDAREKVLDARIHAMKTRLAGAGADECAPLLKELAELYWELVYRGIVQGDLLRHAASEARRYLDEFLEREPRDAGGWALRGRLAALERRDAEAEAAFGTAIELGLPAQRALPYIAELAYRRRDFERVRATMRSLGGEPANALAEVAAYWRSDAGAAR